MVSVEVMFINGGEGEDEAVGLGSGKKGRSQANKNK